MEFKLNELKKRMESEREEEIIRRSEEGLRKKDSIIYYLNKDIENLSQKLSVFEDEERKKIDEINRNHLMESNQLQSKIDELEKVVIVKQNKIDELKDIVNDKTKTIMDNVAMIKVMLLIFDLRFLDKRPRD